MSKNLYSPLERLKVAVGVLAEFTQQNSPQSFPHGKLGKPKKRSWLTKLLLSCWKLFCFKKSPQSEEKITQAVDDLLRFYPLLKESKKEELTLKNYTVKTIKALNRLLEKTKMKEKRRKLPFFLTKKSISFPIPVSKIVLSSPKEWTSVNRDKIIEQIDSKPEISRQEADLFGMKMLSLIKKEGPDSTEALALVKGVPIVVTKQSATEKEVSAIISPLPGETLFFKGSFKKSASSFSTIPIPGSFTFVPYSSQTGFPHPSQHIGWALSVPLIPKPHYPNLLPHTDKLLQRKKRAALALSFKGRLHAKGKALLSLKKAAFEKEPALFLKLHQNLLKRLLLSALPKEKIREANEALETFFLELEKSKVPFQTLVEAYQNINESFISRPYHTLLKSWQKREQPLFFHKDATTRFKKAQDVLVATQNHLCDELKNSLNEVTFKFVLTIGTALGKATNQILLQYFSEVIQWPSFPLDDFAKKLQSLALFQLRSFLTELKEAVPIDPLSYLKKKIEKEMSFWNQETLDPCVQEIAQYYEQQTKDQPVSSTHKK